MNYLIYPCKYMNITQSYLGSYSHNNNYNGYPKDYPIDEACQDEKRSYIYCPCDEMIIKRIYGVNEKGTNTIWLESKNKVITPTFEDYITMLIMHPNDDTLVNLKEGQSFYRKEAICLEGNDGNATGYHFHISISKGKFIYPGWQKNTLGAWVINGIAQKPEDVFYIDKSFTKVINQKNLNFKELETSSIIKPVSRNENVDQIEVLIENLRIRDNPSGNILSLAIPGIYNIISKKEKDGYTWYQISKNKWIAYNESWAKIYLKKDLPASSLTYIYKASKTGDYIIKLYQGEELYIKSKSEDM